MGLEQVSEYWLMLLILLELGWEGGMVLTAIFKKLAKNCSFSMGT